MSFKHFFKTHLTETEIKRDFIKLNEGRWWGKFKEDTTSILEYTNAEGKLKKFKVCKMEEDGSGPAYVLEARGGARYGLFRATEGHFHVIRMKSGKKHLIKPKGIFKEVEGKLIFELLGVPKGAQRIGGGPELIKTAIANKKKPFNPENTLIPQGGLPRVKAVQPPTEKHFNPEATLEEEDEEKEELDERRTTIEPDKSFPNGEPTFDKNTDEWNKGVYTDAKA